MALLIADQAGVSFSGPSGEGRKVTVSFKDVPASAAFKELARLAKLEMQLEEGLVKFLDRGDGSRSFSTIAAGFEEANNLSTVIEQANGGTATVSGSRIIVTGSPEQVARAEAIVQAAQGGRDGWVIEVVVCRISNDLATRIGVGATASGSSTLGINLSGSASGLPDNRVTLSAGATADLLFDLSEFKTHSELLTRASLYVLEGGEASIRQGDVVPIPQRTFSDQGTVTTTGFSFVDTGFIFDCGLRRVGGGRVIANVRPEISSVVGFVDVAPVVSTSTTQAEIVLEPGEWTIVSGLKEQRVSTDEQGFPGAKSPWGKSRSTQSTSDHLLLLVRGNRVASSG